MAYGNGIYITVGSGDTIKRTTNGTTWGDVSSGTQSNLYSVTYAKNTFVVVGSGGIIFTSGNGTDWTSRVSNTT